MAHTSAAAVSQAAQAHEPNDPHDAPGEQADSVFFRLLATCLPKLKRRLLPYNRFGDNLYHRLLFLSKHRRLPGDEMLWNDVLYRLKTTDEILDPLRVFVSDKELVKLYIRATIGEQYNVPTLAVLRSAGEVAEFDFPSRCIIKPTHASAQYILRRQGEPIDLDRIRRWFGLNYYRAGREVNYKKLQPKVIVEPLVFDNADLSDYRFFCYRGEPRLIQVDMDRHTHHTRKILDTEWREQDFSILYPRSDRHLPKPETLPEMLDVARALSAPFSFVRIDLYSDGSSVIAGEITNVSANAGGIFRPLSAEKKASQVMFG
jgi:teichuronopeptide biosynthesis TupA-like protein